MNLKKAGSVICATGVLLSLAVPASAAAAPISSDLVTKEAAVVQRGALQDLFNSGEVWISQSEVTVGQATSSSTGTELGVYFEGVKLTGPVRVNLYLGVSKISKDINLREGAPYHENMVSFNEWIWQGAPIKITVQSLGPRTGFVDNVNAICF